MRSERVGWTEISQLMGTSVRVLQQRYSNDQHLTQRNALGRGLDGFFGADTVDDHMIPVAACADEDELDEFNRKPPEPESAEAGVYFRSLMLM